MSEYDQFNPNKQDQEPPEMLDYRKSFKKLISAYCDTILWPFLNLLYDSFVRGKPIMTTNLSESRFNSNRTKSSNNSNNTYS